MAIADTLDIKVKDDVFKSVIGLSGGCGGICGATAAIGLQHGQGKEEFIENRDTSKILEAVKQVRERFIETYGSYLCYDIQKKLYGRSFDILNPEDREAFIIANPMDKCPKVTENASG